MCGSMDAVILVNSLRASSWVNLWVSSWVNLWVSSWLGELVGKSMGECVGRLWVNVLVVCSQVSSLLSLVVQRVLCFLPTQQGSVRLL